MTTVGPFMFWKVRVTSENRRDYTDILWMTRRSVAILGIDVYSCVKTKIINGANSEKKEGRTDKRVTFVSHVICDVYIFIMREYTYAHIYSVYVIELNKHLNCDRLILR